MTDRVLYQNALEAINEDFVVPKYDAASEELLAKLPVGVQIRYLIRKLRLDIQRCGSCDFQPLDKLVSQLMLELPAWRERFDEWIDYWVDDRFFRFSDIVKEAAYSLVVSRELVTEVLPRIWVRNQIMQSDSETSPFPMVKFAELWNTGGHSSNLLTLAGGDAGDSTKLPLLLVAVLSNKPRIVRALVKNNFNAESHPTLHGLSSFHFAALVGSVDCYRELLRCENGKAMEQELAYDDDPPLHFAAKNGHKHMVDFILGLHSDNREYVNERNCVGQTPLMQAAESGQYDVVQFLLDYPGVDIAAYDDHGKTALVYARRNEDTCCLILPKLPDRCFNTSDDEGNTPLNWLAECAGGKALQMILSLPSILPDKANRNDKTPLCYAVEGGNLEAVKVLGIRRDVDVTKLSKTPAWHGSRKSVIQYAKNRAQKGNNFSQILDWLKLHCKELEAELSDWEISNEGDSEGAGGSDQATSGEE
ncbi:Alpha-latroinsectotoxin-Lt1a [Colletotrichum tropicale]|nr:Alpha-latroinsectotoxin-Lt1a [Colletotrichum tropicale]